MRNRLFQLLIGIVSLVPLSIVFAGAPDPVIQAMQSELNRSMSNLANATPKAPMYFLQYSVFEETRISLSCTDGGLSKPSTERSRSLMVDLRVGSKQLDNTHEIRGGDFNDNYENTRVISFPLTDDLLAMKITLWNETEFRYQKALERYTKVLTNRQVKVAEEEKSDDFADSPPQNYSEAPERIDIDIEYWQKVLKQIGTKLAAPGIVLTSRVNLRTNVHTEYLVSSEGTLIRQSRPYIVFSMSANSVAEDGMELSRDRQYAASTMSSLPKLQRILADADTLLQELKALRSAPVVDPYIGPAILRNRAAGVFFHEIFGHRIEGHRQKDTKEGQTFTKRMNELILPPFLSVVDDPTRLKLGSTDLRGYYKYDSEGVPAQKVTLVDRGTLRTFLTSRSPLKSVPISNGHGRRDIGYPIVSRQGNLIVESDTMVTYDRLRQMLIEECKQRYKPYGLIFDDISGGFTTTRRGGPQAFKVLPLLVYRVYADGRPDEIVRGVDIVGTPLTSFSKIVMAANDQDVFNGTCGAESGMVPVSAISPSLLVTEIEVEKRQKSQEKPPILPPPAQEANRNQGGGK